MARLLLVANFAWNLTNFRLTLARHLRSQGHEVIFAAQRDGSERIAEAEGIRFVHWELRADGVNPLHELRSIMALDAIIRAERPSLVLLYTIKAVIYGGLSARHRRIPFISVITGLGFAFLNAGPVARLSRQLYRLVLRHGRAVVFLNPDDLEAFQQHGLLQGCRAAQLPGEGIDLDHFAPRPRAAADGRLRVLFIGRLLSDKGVREFVEAARLVRSSRKDVVFQLLGRVGAANPTAIPRTELDTWLAAGDVDYLGECDDVRPVIAACDLVVLPSYREGLPRVLLEAAAMERPIVATDVPGCRDVVLPNRTGVLVPVRDAGALASAVTAICATSEAARLEMGKAGRSFVRDRFSDSRVFVVYDSLLELRTEVHASGLAKAAPEPGVDRAKSLH